MHCVCKWGGGAAPPRTPPLVYFPRAGLLQTNPFQTHDANIVLANGGGLRPPQPPRFSIFLGQACFKRIYSKPTMRTLSCQMGGAAPPPTPPLFFFFSPRACAVCFYSDRPASKESVPNPFFLPRASLLQTNRFQTHDACIVFAYGGGILLGLVPFVFTRAGLLHYESVPNPFFTRASLLGTNPFQTHDAGIVLANGGARASLLQTNRFKPMMRALCLQMGGGAAPPRTPPLVYFPRAGLLQTNPFQTHDAGIVLANGGGLRPPPQPPRFSIFLGQACFKRIFSKPTMRTLSCQMGAGLRPPQPPRCFFFFFSPRACAVCFYSDRPASKESVPNPFFYLGQACFKRIPSKPTMRALSWQINQWLQQ